MPFAGILLSIAVAPVTAPSFWHQHFGKTSAFWALAFLGLAVSTGSVAVAEAWAKSHEYSHLATTIVDNVAFLGAFGVLWVGKFVIFNKLMFVDHHAPAA